MSTNKDGGKVAEIVRNAFGGTDPLKELMTRMKDMNEEELRQLVLISANRVGTVIKDGPYDNFDPENAMVIPSLIKRAVDGENPLTVWGDGSPIRDFIYAEDVARGMMLAVEKGIRSELVEDFMTGLKNLFTEHYIDIPEEKVDLATNKWLLNKSKQQCIGHLPNRPIRQSD